MSNHSTRGNARPAEVNSVRLYLATITADGMPREIRMISASKAGRIQSRLLKPEKTSIQEAIEFLAKSERQGFNAYVTVNPLVPETHITESEAAKDTDIQHRSFIPVDIDPIRTSKTLATEAQREAAKTAADAVVNWYGSNYPDHVRPVVGCSGSGWQILLPCTLAATEAADDLVKRLLKTLGDTFSTDAAKIDQTVKNRSRIMRICGTMAIYSDGQRHGWFESGPTPDELMQGKRLTEADLLAYLGEEKPTTKPTVAATGKKSNMPVLIAGNDIAKRIWPYIDQILADISTAADGTKHQTLYSKTARIANYAAGAGLEGDKATFFDRIESALKSNSGTVANWPAARKTISDAWDKGIQSPERLEDRPLSGNGKQKAKIADNASVEVGGKAGHGSEVVGRPTLPKQVVALSADADADELIAPSYSEWAKGRAAMKWHWPGWIPSNQLVLVSGDCFAGKSTLLVYLLALMTTGNAWPDGSPNDIDPGKPVLYLDADNRSDLIGEAFIKAGGDPEKLRLATLPDNINTPLFLDKADSFEILKKYIKGTKPSCVVVDTIARASGIDLTSPQQLSTFTKPLAQMAQDFNVPIVMIGHTNASGQAYGRHVQAVITSSWLVSNDKFTGRRTLSCEFTRAAKPESLSFDIGENGCENFSVLAIPAGETVTEQVDNAIIRILALANQGLTYGKLKQRYAEFEVGSEATFKRSLAALQKNGRVKKRDIEPSSGGNAFPVYYTDEDPPKSGNQTPTSDDTAF